MHFKMSSAICFQLGQSKILSSGNGLTLRYTIFFQSHELLSKVWSKQIINGESGINPVTVNIINIQKQTGIEGVQTETL